MKASQAVKDQKALVQTLAASLHAKIFETHISLVVVGDEFAYKFKKALRFDFLDFFRLEDRRFYCEEEVRLNARMAPDIYIDTVAITGSLQQPKIGGPGEAIEYAVRMRTFDQHALWSWRLEQGVLQAWEIDSLADRLARFHEDAAVAPFDRNWCSPTTLRAIADETLSLIRRLSEPQQQARAGAMQQWEYERRTELRDTFIARKQQGRIRECHGDLHAANIITIDDRVEGFDCIEFNDSLRWIDVMNDLAFAVMDLRFRGYVQFAARLLNRYLEEGGDYPGLPLLRYYEVHRALIRCKIALLRVRQLESGSAEAAASRDEAQAYLAYAEQRALPAQPAVVITHGYSGSGKSTFARLLAQQLDAVQLRSDVERKRIHGVDIHEKGGAEVYTQEATRRTYDRLASLVGNVLDAGAVAVVDAVFSTYEQRRRFAELAQERGVPFFIIDLQASVATMKARIVQRASSEHDASDADVAVLEHQLVCGDALRSEELPCVIAVDAERSFDDETVRAVCRRIHPSDA